jgi:hypothetical protein
MVNAVRSRYDLTDDTEEGAAAILEGDRASLLPVT